MISCFLDGTLTNFSLAQLGNYLIRDLPLNLEKIQVISGIKFIDGVKAKQQNIKINNSDKAA